jgi:acyl dehydratase
MQVLKEGDRLKTFQHKMTKQQMIDFEHVVWDRGNNSHSDLAAAQKDGLSRTIASGQNQMAIVHQMLEENFNDAWVYGGKISLRYIRPVHEDDVLTPNGVVKEITELDGKPRVTLDVWCENQNGDKTSVGTAYAGQPVATRSWL